MPISFEKAVVLGATGATGVQIVAELLRRGVEVRAVSRSETNLQRRFGSSTVELHEADLLDPDAARRAVGDADMVFSCIGRPFDSYDDLIQISRSIAHGVGIARSRCLLVSSYWSYTPLRDLPVREVRRHARPTTRLPAIRRDSEDIILDAGGGVVNLPDFFGPGVDPSLSILNQALLAVVQGGTIRWPGDVYAQRDFVYMPDIGKPLVELAQYEKLGSMRWNLPGSGAVEPRQLIEMAVASAGTQPRLKPVTPIMMWFASLVSRDMKVLRELYPIYCAPTEFDPTRIEGAIGKYAVTPYEKAIAETVRWLRDGQSG